MKVYPADSLDAAAAQKALRKGELACLPTDTVYGLACLPGDAGAIAKLCGLKGRRRNKPMAAVFGSVADVDAVLPRLHRDVRAAAMALLPGPVTVIVDAADGAAATISAALGSPGSIGIRVLPPPLDRIYMQLPTPLVLTSANFSGQVDPCSLDEVAPEVLAACGFAVDAGRSAMAQPSTVVDLRPLAAGAAAAIIRAGAVSVAEINRRLAAAPGKNSRDS